MNFLISGLRWKPSRDTAVAAVSYVLVVCGLYLAFQVFTTARVAVNFITFGPVTLALLGVGLPVIYTVLVRKQPLSDIGLTAQQLVPSLLLGLLLGWDTYRHTLGPLGIVFSSEQVPLIGMSLMVGLFEAIFFRGWLQLRFEEAFGTVPGLLLAAGCYCLYHVGYGMTMAEMAPLFFYGLTFGAMFRLTRNVAVCWPAYTPVGGLFTTLSDGLTVPFEATYGFVLTLALMVAIIAVPARLAHISHRRRVSLAG